MLYGEIPIAGEKRYTDYDRSVAAFKVVEVVIASLGLWRTPLPTDVAKSINTRVSKSPDQK